jgi:hypothetical protein
MDDIWGLAKDAAKVTLGAAKVTTSLITDSTLSTANLLKESAFLTKDIVGATASFTYNTATSGIMKTTDILGLNDAAYNVIKQYLINYLLNNPDEEKFKPLYKNLSYFASGFLLFPVERVRILLMNHHIMIPSSFPIKKSLKINDSHDLNHSFNKNSLKRSYNGAFNCFFKELKNGGFLSLYNGFFSHGIYKLIYFNLLDYRMKSLFTNLLLLKSDKKKAIESNNNKKITNFLCKIFDDKTSKLILLSKDLLLTDLLIFHISHPFHRYSVQVNTFPSEVGFKNYLRENFYHKFNLYQGWRLGMFSLFSKYLLLIPTLKYLHLNFNDDLSLLSYLIPSMMLVEFITYPIELLKYRFMVNRSLNGDKLIYRNIKDAVKKIYLEEHISGFFKGAFTKLINLLIIKSFYLYTVDYYIPYLKTDEVNTNIKDDLHHDDNKDNSTKNNLVNMSIKLKEKIKSIKDNKHE